VADLVNDALVGFDGLYELLFGQSGNRISLSLREGKYYNIPENKNPVVETTGLKPKPSAYQH